jgi:2-polyprenyl-3-methyl-5-hydroxy-6-metoxy-1,4-benzoquinol methylase
MAKREKPYEAHEVLYQKMQAKGVRSWEQYNATNKHRDGLDVYLEQFLKDALSQPWAPKKAKALELGCGTGPISRWLAQRVFSCLGIDISKTAISMAREQSKGKKLPVHFKQADACDPALKSGSFSLIVDGHCLHCITEPKDRSAFLANAYRLLKPGGLFVISTMCRPIDRKKFNELFSSSRLIDSKVYVPWDRAKDYAHSRVIRGKLHMPTRYIGHWKDILGEVKAAGFQVQLMRLNLHYGEESISSLNLGALVPK